MSFGSSMRRKGIVVGACAALVLAGSAGVVVWHQRGAGDTDRPVGRWEDAPSVARTPVALSQGRVAPSVTKPEAAPIAKTTTEQPIEAPVNRAERVRTKPRTNVEESAESAAADGRQKVGELLSVSKLLGYESAPRKETFRYPGASYVKLHFDRMAMLPGDYATVSNPDGTESHRYDSSSASQWAMSVTGDTAVLEMHRTIDPLGTRSLLGDSGVKVDQVARGFSRTEQKAAPEESLTAPGRTGREESVCGGDTTKNAVCYRSKDPVAYTKSKAVARLLIDGTELCTSWRVGPNNRMLTNNHCLDNSDAAYDTEVWFNYQCSTCGGYDTFNPTKVWGEKVLATNHEYDYTLFTVADFAAVQKFGYLTLDAVRPAAKTQLYVPQHPAGDPTRIAGALGDKAANCAVDNPGYTGYVANSDVSYYCDTEGGSSGSPVLSRKSNKVVALHHFGGCPNSGVRADILYARLKSVL